MDRPATPVDDITQVVVPPESAREDLETKPLCGGRRTITWARGPLAGKSTSAYCAEPLCINTGVCTGPRFVPHTVQHESDGTPRVLDPREILPAVRAAAEAVEPITHRKDTRGDSEIRAHVKGVYSRMMAAVQGKWK